MNSKIKPPYLIGEVGINHNGSVQLAKKIILEAKKRKIDDNAQNKDDMRWLMYHFKAPQSLLRLMDNEGDTLSPFVRGDANAAMEKVTGATQKWPPIKDKPTDNTELRSRAETQAYRAWQKWWGKEAAKFKKEQEAGKKRRAEIAEQLEKIRQGENPLEEKES